VQYTNMNTILKTAVLTFLIVGLSRQCYALTMVQGVSSEQEAQELGVKITSKVVGTNLIGIRLELSPRGKLARFHHGELRVASGKRQLLGVTLLPLQQTRDKVVLYFSADADHIKMSTVTIIVSGGSGPDPDGYSFIIKDFVK
jgi:hypothetical protein